MLDLEILRANRAFRVMFPLVVLLVFVWLSRQNVVRGHVPKRVSLAELEKATKGVPFLTLFGRDGRDYRFQAPDGRTFLVDRREVQPLLDASMYPVREGVGLFVTIKDGKIAVPDPKVTTEWVRRHGFSGPLPNRILTVQPNKRRTLPVVRRTKQSEPTLLVLTSDGDWTGEDLERLDAVLNDWLETECPADDTNEPEGERPHLWYDEANSARDLKTIVIRARHFQDAWCEPLAKRLGTEYPFLWQMDVGAKPGPVFRSTDIPAPSARPDEVVD